MWLKILTPGAELVEDGLRSVTLPAAAGELTVLEGHMDCFATLFGGVVLAQHATGVHAFSVVSGLAMIDGQGVTVCAAASRRFTTTAKDAILSAQAQCERELLAPSLCAVKKIHLDLELRICRVESAHTGA